MDRFNDKVDVKAQAANDDASKALHNDIDGVIPPFILKDMAKRNPADPSFDKTLEEMEKLGKDGLTKPRIGRDFGGSREVYDAQGEQLGRGEFGEKARFEGEPASGDEEVDKVYEYLGDVRDFYKQNFNRNSIDDRGMKLVARVNYGDNFQNAYWDGVAMTFGRPGASSPFKSMVHLDVTAHEMAHGVTQAEAGLVYQGQAGALNESMSDVFGEMVDQWAHRTKARDADWIIGKGIWKDSINGKGLRDMLHPGTAFDDRRIGKDPQPDHMDKYVQTTKDNGGVHINSGIPNRAFAEFARAVGGYSWDQPGHIWYRALQTVGRNPSFAQFANATIEAAKDLGYDSLIPKLQKAWDTVGVTPSASEGDRLTPALPKVIIINGADDHGHESAPARAKPAA